MQSFLDISLVSYPSLPTTNGMGPSPIGDLRRWGALNNAG